MSRDDAHCSILFVGAGMQRIDSRPRTHFFSLLLCALYHHISQIAVGQLFL